MTSPTNKDAFDMDSCTYTIDGVQRTTMESMLYLQEKVGMTGIEASVYLRMLRADELRVRIQNYNANGKPLRLQR